MGGVLGSFLSYPFEMLRAAKMHNRNFYEARPAARQPLPPTAPDGLSPPDCFSTSL